MDTQTPEEEILTCSICLETLKEPKVLSCLHRFCESCLKSHITSSSRKPFAPLSCFSCPDCRETIVAPNPTAPPSAWAALFKTDFITKGLIEARKYKQESERNKAPKVRHPCPEHGQVEVNLYCVDCSRTACHICATTTHQNCNCLVTVKKAAEDRRSKIKEQIGRTQPIIEEALVKVKEMRFRIVDFMAALVEKEITELTQRVHSLVNNEIGKLIKELHKNHDDLRRIVFANFFTLSESTNNLQCLVNRATLKMVFTSDVDLLADIEFNDAIDSSTEQCVSINQQFDSLYEKLSRVTCELEVCSPPRANLGNILFQSEITDNNVSDEPGMSRKRTASANHVQCPKCTRIRLFDEPCAECDLQMNKKKKTS